ncbi:MAG: hypothetical protein IJH65_06855 [Methanobrevibacter sp.]|nr:hypothetical protein [Methanobrevibacter sp.]MBR0351315.1 hypothetical protein [Clostridia bacterium]
MKEKLAKLIDLKSIVTLCLTGLLIYGLVANKFDANDVMTIIVMVFTFYFAKKDKEVDQ